MSNSALMYPGSTLAYVSVITICCLIAYLSRGSKGKGYPVAIALILTIFVGFRTIGVGIDTAHFYDHFNSPVVFGVETGFLLFMRLVSSLNGSYSYVLIISAAITYFCFVMRLWELRDKLSFTVAIFALCALFLPYSMNTFRQFIVLGVVFWASRYFFRRQYVRYCVIVISCVLIHKTAVIAFALLALIPLQLKDFNGNKRTFALLFCLSMPLIAFIAGYVLVSSGEFASYSRYLVGEETGRSGAMAVIKLMFVILVITVLEGKRRALLFPDSESKLIALVAIFGICLEPLNTVSPYLDRVALYFSVYQIALFGILYKNASKRSRTIIAAGVFVICGYALYSSLASNGHGIMPYEMISPLTLLGIGA